MVRTTGPETAWSRRRLDPAAKARLFPAAAEAFARDGFDRASLNGILAEAGLGKSSFFYHFADKEDLFAAVIEDIVERIAERVGPTPLPDNPKGIWVAAGDLIRRWGEAVDAEPNSVALLRALQPLRRTAGPRLQNVMSAARRSFEPLLERGIALGAVRSDLDPTTLMAMIEAVNLVLDDTFHRQPNPDATAVETHRTLVFDAIERLLRPSSTKRRRGTAIGRKGTRAGAVRLPGPRL